MHWSVMTLTTIGYGDIAPTNPIEYYCCCVMMLTMAALWAMLISHLFVVASSADPVTVDSLPPTISTKGSCTGSAATSPAHCRPRGKPGTSDC